MSFGVPGLTPPIPALENFSVTGDPGAVRLHAGGLQSTSNLLSGQGRQISSIGSALAPHWNGEAATSFHGRVARSVPNSSLSNTIRASIQLTQT